MITTPEEALTELKRLGFPAILERIVRGDIPDALDYIIAPVKLYYKFWWDLHERLPVSQNYLPLWESNGDAVVAYDTKRDTFVRHYYGDEADETLGRTYQQFVTAFFLKLIDADIWDELEELAMLFEYKHLERLRAFAESSDDEDYPAANRRFIASIPD